VFTQFLQLFLAGVAQGCVYALVALGFVLIYKATETVNFAQGDLMMLGAFVALTFVGTMGMNYWLGFLLAALCMAVLGYLLDALILRRIIGQPQFAIVILTISLGFLFRAGAGAKQEAQADGQDDDGELRLADDPAQDQRVEQVAEHGHAERGQQEAQPVVHPHGADEGERHEGAQHHQVALGEIDRLGRLVDQHEAERDERVHAALRDACKKKLQELGEHAPSQFTDALTCAMRFRNGTKHLLF